MKPLYLEMNAFGPYAGRQVIDFRRLEDHKLFLIYGPTGAGKTTVLDAMCYALYGETSGNRRSGAHMRSEYASPEEETYVVFAFAIGPARYCVERRPEQQIAKKRGTGLKKSAASAALYAVDEKGEKTAVIATKKVGEEASETIIAAKNGVKEDTVGEISDLLYHLVIMMANEGISPADVKAELGRRHQKEGNLKKFHQVDKNT